MKSYDESRKRNVMIRKEKNIGACKKRIFIKGTKKEGFTLIEIIAVIAIIRTLSSCGVNGKILNSIQLAELLYMAYNREGAEAFGIERALKAGYDQLYSTAPDVLDKKIVELDKEVEKQATIMAREKILQAKTEKEIEIEQREKSPQDYGSWFWQSK